MKCNKPPEGWACTREAGHEGPCAAVPAEREAMLDAHFSYVAALHRADEKIMEKTATQMRLEEESVREHTERIRAADKELARLRCEHAIAEARISSPAFIATPEQAKAIEVTRAKCRKELDDQMGEVAKLSWTLRSLVESLDGIQLKYASADMARNLRLAVEHLQDAQHRIERLMYEHDQN